MSALRTVVLARGAESLEEHVARMFFECFQRALHNLMRERSAASFYGGVR